MEEVTSTARRKFSFPSPVDVNSEDPDEQDQENDDERQTAVQSAKAKRKGREGSISQKSAAFVRQLPDYGAPRKSEVGGQRSVNHRHIWTLHDMGHQAWD